MFHKRKHIRLRDYDYSLPNAYFLTICVKGFAPVLGEIRNGIMGLSSIGNAAACCLQKIEEIRTDAELHEFIIMPNHLHVILVLNKKDDLTYRMNAYGKPVAGSVSVIINQFKGAVKKWCNTNGYGSFQWQSRFYDHVIRDAESFDHIANYIRTNPANWQKDNYCRDLPLANPADITGKSLKK